MSASDRKSTNLKYQLCFPSGCSVESHLYGLSMPRRSLIAGLSRVREVVEVLRFDLEHFNRLFSAGESHQQVFLMFDDVRIVDVTSPN